MKRGFRLTGEKLVNLGLFLLSAFYLGYSLSHYQAGTLRMPKEGSMPLIVGIGATVISAFLTVQSMMDKGDAQNVHFGISWRKFFLLVAVSLAYALLLNTLGYMLASFLFLLAVLKTAGVEGVRKPLIISLVAAVAFYVLFRVGLGVVLPAGLLGI